MAVIEQRKDRNDVLLFSILFFCELIYWPHVKSMILKHESTEDSTRRACNDGTVDQRALSVRWSKRWSWRCVVVCLYRGGGIVGMQLWLVAICTTVSVSLLVGHIFCSPPSFFSFSPSSSSIALHPRTTIAVDNA